MFVRKKDSCKTVRLLIDTFEHVLPHTQWKRNKSERINSTKRFYWIYLQRISRLIFLDYLSDCDCLILFTVCELEYFHCFAIS